MPAYAEVEIAQALAGREGQLLLAIASGRRAPRAGVGQHQRAHRAQRTDQCHLQIPRIGMLAAAVGAGGGHPHIHMLDVLDTAAGGYLNGRFQAVLRGGVVIQRVGQIQQRVEELVFRAAVQLYLRGPIDSLLRHDVCFRNVLVHRCLHRAAFRQRFAAAHTPPVFGQRHRRFGIGHAKTVTVAVVQGVVGAVAIPQWAATLAPAAFLRIHLAGGAGQNQRHVPPGQFRSCLQHQRDHARHHRCRGRGAGKVVDVGILEAGGHRGGQIGQGIISVARGGTHRQVGPAFTVLRPNAGRVGCTGRDYAQRTH